MNQGHLRAALVALTTIAGFLAATQPSAISGRQAGNVLEVAPSLARCCYKRPDMEVESTIATHTVAAVTGGVGCARGRLRNDGRRRFDEGL